MKKILLPLLALTAVTAHADYFTDALRDGRETCQLRYDVVNPNDVAKIADFPGVPYAPTPGISSHVVGQWHYYHEGQLECGSASAALVWNPGADVACVMSSGPYEPYLMGGVVVGSTPDAAAATLVKKCVASERFVSPCLGQWIACFNRK